MELAGTASDSKESTPNISGRSRLRCCRRVSSSRIGVVFVFDGESFLHAASNAADDSELKSASEAREKEAKSKLEHPATKSRQNDRIILQPDQVRLIPERVLEMLTEIDDMLRNL